MGNSRYRWIPSFYKETGVKPDSPKDIAVSIYYPNGSFKPPTHSSLKADFKKKCKEDPKISSALFSQIKKVQECKEPDWESKNSLGGLPVEVLLHALKWVWIQEDRNYPSPKYLGRRISWAGYLLFYYGDLDSKTAEGEKLLKKHGYEQREGIDRIRYRSDSRHLR